MCIQRARNFLQERLLCAAQEPAVSLIHSDVLLLKNIRDILDDFGGGAEGPSIKMVANIPYNITSGACSHRSGTVVIGAETWFADLLPSDI